MEPARSLGLARLPGSGHPQMEVLSGRWSLLGVSGVGIRAHNPSVPG